MRALRLLALSVASALLAATTASGHSASGAATGAAGHSASAATTSAPGVSLHQLRERHPGRGGCTIELTYPELVGGAPGVASIDAQLSKDVRHEVASFLAEVRADKIPPSMPTSVATSQLFGTVTSDVETAALVGFTTDVYDYPAGAAHGVTAVTTYDFDPANGHRYQLDELFRPGSPWLALLSQESRRLLPPILGELTSATMLDPGTTPKASNFEGWSLTPFGLLITFGDYQVAAYAAGTPTIRIPFSALRAVASPYLRSFESHPATAMTLLPARTPPVAPECYANLQLSNSAVPEPLTCDHGRVNVAAWTMLAGYGLQVLAVGSAAKPAGVQRAMCLDQGFGSPAYLVAAEQLASVYYGWQFGSSPARGYPRFCPRLG